VAPGKEVEQVGSFGEHLRQQRELRGVSLEEIVATTKIGRRLLQALEDEQFDLLPGGIFNRAYVRAYAKCVGLNEDEAVAEYLEAAQEPPPDNKVIAHQHTFHSDRIPERATFPFVPVLILLVVVAGAVGGWKAYQEHQKERERLAAATSPAEASAGVAGAQSANSSASPVSGATERATSQPSTLASSTPSAPTGNGATENRAAATNPPAGKLQDAAHAGGEFEVTIRPKDRAWVSVKSDGKYVVRGIIKPPDVKTIRATGEVVFFTGNAGEVELAFNGKSVPLNGGINQQETVVFDSKGVQPRAAAQ
jgi:cytoskeleton protein RodZ